MLHTAHERLYNALNSLCGSGSSQERLQHAIEEIMPLRDDEFPPEISLEYADLIQSIQKISDPNGVGRLPTFCEKLTDEDAQEISEKICSWYSTVAIKHCS